MLKRYSVALCTTILLLFAATASGAAPALVEFTVAKEVFQGKAVASNQSQVWLIARDGQLHTLPLAGVESYRKVSPRFRGFSRDAMQRKLRKELGRGFDVVSTSHYLVGGEQQRARKYAALFEEIYRSFEHYFSVRGFRIKTPEFPLVAIVFSDRKSFVKYAAKDGIRAGRGLAGYYLPTTNRVALFDIYKSTSAVQRKQTPLLPAAKQREPVQFFASLGPVGSISGNLKETIVHEATHQVAFNTGLHSRIASDPRWVVEGLATVFEAPAIRDRDLRRKLENRINRDRYVWFGNYVKSRREPKSLQAFIASDKPFFTTTLDAYSQAWALTFFLVETRSADYAKFLRRIADRDPLEEYTPEQRVADFKRTFGDIPVFEAHFLRFLAQLKPGRK